MQPVLVVAYIKYRLYLQVLMGVARLGFVATYLSDSLVSGFTTGTAVLVVITQVKLILQVPVPQASGVFGALKVSFNLSLKLCGLY